MKKILILTAHGLGDNILGLPCAKFIKEAQVDIVSCSRDEVYQPLESLFKGRFNLSQHPLKDSWGSDNWILDNQHALSSLRSNYDEIYYVIPDLLFNSPLAFPFKKYNCHPQAIKTTRLLTDSFAPSKTVYVGLVTSTDGYLYGDIPSLLNQLAGELPDYTIYFPMVSKWGDRELNLGNFNIPFRTNVFIDFNPSFKDSIEWMKKSAYGIYTDNGSSHIAYHLGQPRLLLDPRFGLSENTLPWIARWRETLDDSIHIATNYKEVASLVAINLRVPQTTLVPRCAVLNQSYVDWMRLLFFKY